MNQSCRTVLVLAIVATMTVASCESQIPTEASESTPQSELAQVLAAAGVDGVSCLSDADCGDSSLKCVPVSCNELEGGQCIAAEPLECPRVWEPVCGCNGQTYPNECFRLNAGVGLASEGVCPKIVCGGFAGLPCPDGQACQIEVGTCGVTDNTGICVPQPDECGDAGPKVCGCNGETFANKCEAFNAGTSIQAFGSCPGSGCSTSADCDEDEFCRKAPGMCTELGQCKPTPPSCSDADKPVCGCNGVEYPNSCQAAQAGMSIANAGSCCEPVLCGFPFIGIDSNGDGCQDSCVCGIVIDCLPGFAPVDTDGDGCDDTCAELPCEVNADCGFGQYCNLDGCESPGTCAFQPEICAAVVDPVCGCDGETYSNSCVAGSNGVSVAFDGICPPTGGCSDNSECAPNEFCAKEGCDGEGECAVKPEICIALFDPVCGCDGTTYSNGCVAASNGVNIASDGECGECPFAILCTPGSVPVDTDGDGCDDTCIPDSTGCNSNADCGPGLFCLKESCESEGTCEPTPVICPTIFMPVCGCDGVTYNSACTANAEGMNVAAFGECAEESCDENDDCLTGQYCQKPLGECGEKGTCQPQPEGCGAVFDPVCGCDGLEYSNACIAAAAGISVQLDGPCGTDGGCEANKDCDEGLYCAKVPSDCDGTGTCEVPPTACIFIFAPVCGCDGESYSNSCFAASASTNVASNGGCGTTP